MSINKTIVAPGRPMFGLYEIAYARVSAAKGYIEPLQIVNIGFDNVTNNYQYSFSRDAGNPSGPRLPTQLLEYELITLCEALDLQISFLNNELNNARQELTDHCQESQAQPSVQVPDIDRQISYPQAPRFGVNQVVYLTDTANSVGRLESYRVNWLRYEPKVNQWVYMFHLRKQPGSTMTIGDRDDMRRSVTIEFAESELCTLCEALPLVVSFLEVALDNARRRRLGCCSGGSGSNGN